MSKFIVFILSASLLMSAEAYCQQKVQSQQQNTIFGSVVQVDVEGGIVYIQTDKGKTVFYLSAESDLFQLSHRMSSLELSKGDPVRIQYIIGSSGKNNVISLVDNGQPKI